MTTNPNYFKLGLFILTALFLLVTAIIVFGSGVMGQEKIYFETYFKDSVSGLSPGAPVQDNGVEIGTVEKISFIRNDYDLPETENGFSKYHPYVRVVCSVSPENLPEITEHKLQDELNVLIENGMRLRLSTNILTGQGFIEADYFDDLGRFPVEQIPWQTEYPYIPSAPSTFTTLKDSVDRILYRLEQIDTQEIAQNLNRLLQSVDKAVTEAQVAALTADMRTFMAEVRETNQHMKKLIEDPTAGQQLTNIAEMIDNLDTTLTQIDQLIQTQSPQVAEAIQNLKYVSENLKNLTEDLQDHPSAIFSPPPPKKETSK